VQSFELNREERLWLLALARKELATCTGGPIPDIGEPPSAIVDTPCGAFVTLHKSGRLRGCIGTFRNDLPLHKVVAQMARAAAAHDSRFKPVVAAETGLIDIEISVLTPMEPLVNVEELVVGTHGLYVTMKGATGVLLPQVATEWGMNKEQFLEAVCEKAGLPPYAWKTGASLFTFQALVFGEKDEKPFQDS